MNAPDQPNRNSLPRPEAALPAELEAAIVRARQRVASLEMVERLTANVLRLTPPNEHRSFAARHLNTVWIWGGAIAAAIVLFFSYGFRQPQLPEVVQDNTSLSSITKISLVSFSYSKIDEDLERAEAKAVEVSEGLELAIIRFEIRESLERFYNWSE